MRHEKLNSMAYRLFFLGAFLLLGLAFLEKATNLFGYTILRGTYTGGRLLEFAAYVVTFAIALLLRQVREELKK